MAVKTAENVTHSYYFNPLTQNYQAEAIQEPSVYIRLITPRELPISSLTKVIQTLGNHMALGEVKGRSVDTQRNYCYDFTAHASTCEQSYGSYCKRHLTEEELNVCAQLEKHWNPLLLGEELHADMRAFNIPRGDVDQMRRILTCVRSAIQ